MRLTIKAKEPYEFAEDNFILNERIRVNYQQNISNDVYYVLGTLLNKLGQLEDIEEELGIDLIILFKVSTSNVFYVKGCKNIRSVCQVDLRGKYITDYEYCRIFYFKDYGKTWALTKEELL